MAKLTPYIMSEDARKQAEFYARAFRGEIVSVTTYAEMGETAPELKDKVAHLALKAGELQFFLNDYTPKAQAAYGALDSSTRGVELLIEFPTEAEVRLVFDGLAEGGKVFMPVSPMPWGAMWGSLEDRFGIRWQIATAP